jgi:proline iminopeptidase
MLAARCFVAYHRDMATKRRTVLRGKSAAKKGSRNAAPARATRQPAATRAKRKSAARSPALRTLYPSVKANRTGFLRVSEVHEIYYEESGNPRGKPAVFVHGGPGGGTDPKMRSFFDPKRYRIILFDQRGCGKSRPHASLVDNTTWHLVEDMEKLREHLGIERWLVFGGSWGSTLALAYAETHPQRVSELVLRGIFLLRRWEIEWFYQNPGGAGALYPDLWERYVEPVPEAERGDMIAAYYKLLTSDNAKVLGKAARAWSVWEGATSFLRLNPDYIAKFQEDAYAAAFARIECHYFVNKGFFRSDNQLLEDVGRIRKIPTIIVQGRYDVICPMKSAWDLHRAWPEADLRIVPDAGHSAFEAGNIHELISATDRFAKSR